MGDAFDVETARGHIGGDEDVDLAVLEILDGLLALRLLHVAVDRGGGEPARLQFFGELIGAQFGAREHQHRIVGFGFEDAGQRIEFVQSADEPETLADIRRCGGLGGDGDFRRVAQIGLGDAADLAGHGRREQRDLARFRHFLQHGLDIVDEAHAQHFVGFVQHQRLEFGQIKRAAIEVINDPARGADNDVNAALQRLQLRVVALAAIDRQHVEARQLVGVALEGLGDLDRELARGRQHQHLRLGFRHVQPRQQRQGECGGLAGAGLGLSEHVATGHQRRNGRRLDRRRGLVSDLFHCGHHTLGQTEIGKTQGGGFGGHAALPDNRWSAIVRPDARVVAPKRVSGTSDSPRIQGNGRRDSVRRAHRSRSSRAAQAALARRSSRSCARRGR